MNEENHSPLDGFDEVEPTEQRVDRPIETLFEKTPPMDTTAPFVSESEKVTPDVTEPVAEGNPEPQKSVPETPVASYTPGTTYHFVPNNSRTNPTDSWQNPTPVYLNHPPKDEPKAKRTKKSFVVTPAAFVATILAVAVLCTGIGVGTSFLLTKNRNTDSPTPSPTNPNSTITIDDSGVESVVEAVYAKTSPAIVGVRTTVGVRNYFFGESTSSGEGTGIVYSADGYIITCFHVIENVYSSSVSSSKIEVFLPNDSENGLEASVVGYNRASDVALLKVNKTGLTTAEFSTSKDLHVGQYVVAIGNPGGLQFMSSVSYGVISGLNRTVSIEGLGKMKLIQTDAAINPGNSGGALVNTAGQVVAMNSSKYVSDEYEGMGFAIPIDTVLDIVTNIMNKKDTEQPYIGIEYYTNVTAEWLAENNLPKGIIVKSVVEGGPAESAGLRSGDIIVEFNNTVIENVETFTKVLSNCKPGKTVSVKIYRSGKYYTGAVSVGSNNAVN